MAINSDTIEIQKLDKNSMYLHQQLASGSYGDTDFVIDQPLPTSGLIVVIGKGEDREKYFVPLRRIVDQVFEFRATRKK